MVPNLVLRTLALAALAAAALPASAAPSLGPGAFAGIWQSPWPPDQLRRPGDPAPPVEVGPPPLKPQYLQAWRDAQKAAADAVARGAPPVTDNVRCIPGGFPGMMSPVFPLEVLVTPKQINITNEANAQTRRIYMNEKQIAVDDAEPVFFGHSVGRWVGDMLVVDTIGMKPNVRMRGVPHSPNMQVDEKIRLTSSDAMEDQITITDPEYLTEPWTFTFHYRRMLGYKLGEFVCENNREFADPKTGGQRLDLGR